MSAFFTRLRAKLSDGALWRRLVTSLSEQSTYSGLLGVALAWGIPPSRMQPYALTAAAVFGAIKWALPDAAPSPIIETGTPS